MNKAFVKEPDAQDPRCPGCEGLGEGVPWDTLLVWVPEDRLKKLARDVWFCATATCSVVYFDGWGEVVEASAVPKSIWPKDPRAPVCECFGLRAEEIEEDARAGITERVKAHVARSETPEAKCGRLSPRGRSCEQDVRALFMRAYSGR